MLIEKLLITQAVETEFAGIPAKRLSAGYSTSQSPENQVKKDLKLYFFILNIIFLES